MNDEQLRRLLEDAVSDVEPREGLDAIRARTRVRSMSTRRSWLLGAGGAVVATAATVVAVAVLADGGAGDEPGREPGFAGPSASTGAVESAAPTDPSSPTPQPSSSTTGSTPATTSTVPVYYVGETSRGTRLYREFHRVPDDGNAVLAALTEAVSTPPDDPDYRTAWPAGTVVLAAGVQETDDDRQIVAVLSSDVTDLRSRPTGMTPEEAERSVQQLVYTAQAAAQERLPVQLLYSRDGGREQRTDQLLGVPVAEPLAEAPVEEVLAQVWVIDPADGAEVTSPFTVNGLAAAFEANVVWELRRGEQVVDEGFTMARECCKMEPYSFEVSAPPGEYTLVVQDTDPSAGEGPGVWEDTKQVTVLP